MNKIQLQAEFKTIVIIPDDYLEALHSAAPISTRFKGNLQKGVGMFTPPSPSLFQDVGLAHEAFTNMTQTGVFTYLYQYTILLP